MSLHLYLPDYRHTPVPPPPDVRDFGTRTRQQWVRRLNLSPRQMTGGPVQRALARVVLWGFVGAAIAKAAGWVS